MEVGRTAASFPAADEDYFADMDYGYRRDTDPSVKLDAADVRGRVSWIVWTFGNDRFWDYMANHTFGAFDLLKILSSHSAIGYCTEDYSGRHDNKYEGSPYAGMDEAQCKAAGKTWALTRDHRWKYYGLVNEPCFEKADGARRVRAVARQARAGVGGMSQPIPSRTRPNTRASRSVRAAAPCRSAPTTASRRASSGCACFPTRPSTTRRSRNGTAKRTRRARITPIPNTTTTRTWSGPTASACHAASATSGRTR